MTETARITLLRDFADSEGWADAPMTLIAGDASNRKYYRLQKPDGARALIMDAPPQKGEDVRPFVRIAHWLTDAGLSAPRIFAEESETGMLLIEDFGDALFARLLEKGADEMEVYEAATDVLIALHNHPPDDTLARYDAAVMADAARLSMDWYRDGIAQTADPALSDALHDLMQTRLAPLDGALTCLTQRDYHAENLIWLPDRTGVARVGLLDFQDAMCGHPAYDLVSILQDARRDVSPTCVEAMITRYINAQNADGDAFRHAYHLLGLQRNLRILGVFARLCLRDGKPGYLPKMPRVWDHVMYNLEHLSDPELTAFLHKHLPEPIDTILAKLAAQCPKPAPQ